MKTQKKLISGGILALLLSYACTYDVVPDPAECSQAPVPELIAARGANCGQENGEIEVGVRGGSGEYRFSRNGTDFQPGGRFTGLPAGTYQITVRNADGCSATLETVVENTDGVNISLAVTDADCGTASGAITVTPNGGQPPYQYRLNEGAFGSESRFSSLANGTYTVTARDAGGCEVSQTVPVGSGVSFAGIKTIISTNCAVSGCHAGSISPDLRTDAAIRAQAARIQARTSSQTMPPRSSGSSLTDDQIAQISCWVQDGAPAPGNK
jgi:hypothetical protein